MRETQVRAAITSFKSENHLHFLSTVPTRFTASCVVLCCVVLCCVVLCCVVLCCVVLCCVVLCMCVLCVGNVLKFSVSSRPSASAILISSSSTASHSSSSIGNSWRSTNTTSTP